MKKFNHHWFLKIILYISIDISKSCKQNLKISTTLIYFECSTNYHHLQIRCHIRPWIHFTYFWLVFKLNIPVQKDNSWISLIIKHCFAIIQVNLLLIILGHKYSLTYFHFTRAYCFTYNGLVFTNLNDILIQILTWF